MGSSDVLYTLQQFNDIPDNFMYWEVVNSDRKKSGTKVPVNVRTMAPDSKGEPTIRLLTDEEQAKIPKDFMVRIYICNRPLKDNEPKGNIDKDIDEG